MDAYSLGPERRANLRRAALADGVDWRIGDDDRFLGKDWLSDAALSGDLETVVQAFSGGYDWDINDRTSGEQGTVLLNAIRGCHRHTRCVDIVEWLLAHGADPNAGSDGHCRTCPLHLCGKAGARAGDFLRIATMLIEAGADVNARRGVFSEWAGRPNAGGHTVLHCAAKDGGVEFIRLLLKMGADIHARAGVDYMSPLEIAYTEESRSQGLPDNYLANYRASYRASRALLEDVFRAGSWKSYVLVPRKELLALRVLCEQGRARTAHPILGRLFPWSRPPPRDERAPKPRLRAMDGGPVPKEIFWHVVGFWRSSRDSDELRSGVRLADLRLIAEELSERLRAAGYNVPDVDAARMQCGPVCRDLLADGVLNVGAVLRVMAGRWGRVRENHQ